MKTEINLKQLDFSGGPNSWFDLWHTHVDWDNNFNKNWSTKKIFIDKLLEIYELLKVKLKKYPHDYQVFISIIENDLSQNAVYIHSKNPNLDNFPINIVSADKFKIKDKELNKYISGLGLEIVPYIFDNELQYYLFDRKYGIPLTK
ncbi:MAG: hypothetical protein HY951_12115 [Bacteroidia bacterium]|nr:hypothetical protein [Bacteroidia bacterium]